MKLTHPSVTSSFFELIKTYEFDTELTEDDHFSLRIELFQSLGDQRLFRYKSWRYELFNIQSIFPQDAEGNPEHEPSDELMLVEPTLYGFSRELDFYADDPSDALNKIVDDFNKSLVQITSIEAKISSDK